MVQTIRITTVSITGLLVFSGCGGIRSDPQYSFQSKQEVVQAAVLDFPTTTIIPFSEGRGAVERLRYLFTNTLKLSLHDAASIGSSGKSWKTSSEHFLFHIKEESNDEGLIYKIYVLPRSSDDAAQAELNAKNISRFIAQGTFERSLFVL